jgi:1,4-alpha-glucan branching enzyme
MIRFNHPQAIHFFEQNLVYLMQKFHIDGFRFDATWVIRHGAERSWPVVQPGSSGGWGFMHRLRSAAHAVDPRCIFMAEHLPNEWDMTRFGGPVDSQWCDDYHDRIVDACRGWWVMSSLADALKVTHTSCNQWYEATNYSESHDEVGNVPDRIVNVGGFGQGLRRNKVAAAATLASRGIPMWFMGAEAGEWRQFRFDGAEPLDIPAYLSDQNALRLQKWWRSLCDLRRGNASLQGPAPLDVRFCQESCLAFSRGMGGDYFVVLNFGGGEARRKLWEMNLPEGTYREQLNSTWPEYAVESEGIQDNGGGQARLGRGDTLRVPGYGAVVLQRIG